MVPYRLTSLEVKEVQAGEQLFHHLGTDPPSTRTERTDQWAMRAARPRCNALPVDSRAPAPFASPLACALLICWHIVQA